MNSSSLQLIKSIHFWYTTKKKHQPISLVNRTNTWLNRIPPRIHANLPTISVSPLVISSTFLQNLNFLFFFFNSYFSLTFFEILQNSPFSLSSSFYTINYIKNPSLLTPAFFLSPPTLSLSSNLSCFCIWI